MDHHVPRAIMNGMRLCGVDVLTAHEDGTSELPDTELLDRATELERVLFTQDDDLLAEAAQRHRQSQTFSGVIYAQQLHVSIGDCIRDLEIIVQAGEREDIAGQVLFLPL